MSAPCIRIELEYADGARQVATGDAAECIRQWLNTCQAWTAENPEIVYDGPQMRFIDADERTSRSDLSDSLDSTPESLGDKPPLTTEATPGEPLRGDQESA